MEHQPTHERTKENLENDCHHWHINMLLGPVTIWVKFKPKDSENLLPVPIQESHQIQHTFQKEYITFMN